jgi:hydrogenase maturation protease
VSDPLRAIADAVLYEGYLLWPYRRSAMKNARRFTFGGVYPRAHSEAREDDPWTMRTEVLLEGGPDARLDVSVRFLHVVERRVARRGADGLDWVDELTVGGERHLAWQEATERELGRDGLPVGDLARAPVRVPVTVPGGREEEVLGDGEGAVVRTWEGLEGAIDVSAQALSRGLWRVRVEIANTTRWTGGSREEALRRTLCSTHTVVRAPAGGLVSLTDPPPELREAAAACRNEGTWPVLVGEPGERHTVLSSPIILEDHPRIAPESPGDLFDGGEIDGLLVLNILALTDEEKAEMRDSDPRAREILERTEALTNDELMNLHGAIREFRSVGAR